MAKKQPPKKASASASVGKTKKTMYDFNNVHTGDAKTDPGVLKAKADKAKRDKIIIKNKKK